MKNLFIAIAILLFATNSFAQTVMHEGHINYTISITGNEQVAQQMNGSTMDLSIKDSMSRVDMNMSIMQTNVITNNVAKKGTLLMNMMGNKYAISMSPQDIKDEEAQAPDYDVKYIDSTKVIAGHVCKKAIVSIKSKKDVKPFTVWYAPDITIPVNNKNMYSKINGLPLEYSMEQGAGGQTINMEFQCTLIDNKPVDPSIFTIPDGYQTMTMDQFKSAMGGLGGH